MSIRDTEVYKAAINTYGETSQLFMSIEEMSELQKELCKHVRKWQNREAIAEEIADVKIMLDQLEIIFDCHILVSKYKRQKIWRLAKNLWEGANGLETDSNT